MAVMKSTAYGQVRKSVGENNYYRRAGVQIVRSKPTFAPGRTFTNPQLRQQNAMKLVQYMLLQQNAKVLADYSNVPNNKVYNASSRYNRLVKAILPLAKTYATDQEPNFAQFWSSNAIKCFFRFSVGNILLPRKSELWQFAGDVITFEFKTPVVSTDLMLQQINKRRSKENQYTVDNIGICGMFQSEPNTASIQVIYPTMVDTVINEEGAYSFNFFIEKTIAPETIVNGTAAYCLFIADRESLDTYAPLSTASYCTSSYYNFGIK